jgi:hypothetical protein
MTGAGGAPAAVLLMASAPGSSGGSGEAERELLELLGADRADALRAALQAEAEAWAARVGPGAVHHADGPLAEATARVLAEHSGPLLVAWPVLARWRPGHAEAALGDLAAGCQLAIGPIIDGGVYLLGLGELVPAPDDAWGSADAMTTAFAAAVEAGFEVGILRAERALRRAADVRAALADPVTPGRIAAILGR